MSKEEGIKDFFKSLKISLKNYSIYDKEHPSYKKSIKRLKIELDKLFKFFDHSIQIGFTSDSIFIENDYFGEEKLFVDVAKMFHFRKIKSLEIKPSITLNELELFLSKAYLPRKDILKRGGIKKLLDKEKISNIRVKELDYSQLLKGEGEEIKDIWTYLLKEAVQEENEQKMNYLANNYDRIYDKLNAEEILSDSELNESFKSFFLYLYKNKYKNYISFSRRLMKSAVSSKQISSKEKIDSLRPLFTDLSEKVLASTLWEEISTNDDFNQVNFSNFFQLVEEEKHKKVADSLLDVFHKNQPEKESIKTKQKIRELLSGTSSPLLSKIYRSTLESILKDISDKKATIYFDSIQLQKNYQLILLNMLEKTSNKETATMLIEHILKEWEDITKREDLEYLRYIHETLNEKREILSSLENYQELESILIKYIEELILKGELSLQFNYFLESLNKSLKDENVYLKKIFNEEVITPYILRAFFRFFTDYLFYFNLNLEQRANDPIFLKKVINSLSLIDTPISLITLKNIFKMGNDNIKIKILRSMKELTEHDDKFLFPLIKKKQYDLKKEAFILLARRESSKHNALETLFSLSSPFGLRNKSLHEHIRIMDELDVRSAKKYLTSLANKKFIWNKKLRNHARRVLEKWNVRKS